MSPALLAVVIGAAWALGLVAFIGAVVLVNVLRGYRLGDRLLGPASSDRLTELAPGLLSVMDDDPTPCGRRHP